MIAVGASVAVTGAIAFVGLIVPHLCRPFVGHTPSRLLIPSAIGGALLVLTADIAVPKDRDDSSIAHGVPITYVPARNTIFLSFALAYAETIRSSDIAIGVNAIDYSGYPDCRPEFIASFERLANLATAAATEDGARFKIHTPLQMLSKAGIVRLAVELGVPVGRTLSCYDPLPNGTPCGHCDACILRRKGFAEAGIVDGG
mgnify:CR=1 FL=1